MPDSDRAGLLSSAYVRLRDQDVHLPLHLLHTGKQGHLHSSSGLLAARTAHKDRSALCMKRFPLVSQHLQTAGGSATGRRCRGKGWEGSHALRVIMRAGDWRHDRGILAVNQEILSDPQPPPCQTPLPSSRDLHFNTSAWKGHCGRPNNLSVLCGF